MGSLFSKPKIPAPPPIIPPTPMPDMTAVDNAKKKSIVAQQARSGRQSTILSDTGGYGL